MVISPLLSPTSPLKVIDWVRPEYHLHPVTRLVGQLLFGTRVCFDVISRQSLDIHAYVLPYAIPYPAGIGTMVAMKRGNHRNNHLHFICLTMIGALVSILGITILSLTTTEYLQVYARHLNSPLVRLIILAASVTLFWLPSNTSYTLYAILPLYWFMFSHLLISGQILQERPEALLFASNLLRTFSSIVIFCKIFHLYLALSVLVEWYIRDFDLRRVLMDLFCATSLTSFPEDEDPSLKIHRDVLKLLIKEECWEHVEPFWKDGQDIRKTDSFIQRLQRLPRGLIAQFQGKREVFIGMANFLWSDLSDDQVDQAIKFIFSQNEIKISEFFSKLGDRNSSITEEELCVLIQQ